MIIKTETKSLNLDSDQKDCSFEKNQIKQKEDDKESLKIDEEKTKTFSDEHPNQILIIDPRTLATAAKLISCQSSNSAAGSGAKLLLTSSSELANQSGQVNKTFSLVTNAQNNCSLSLSSSLPVIVNNNAGFLLKRSMTTTTSTTLPTNPRITSTTSCNNHQISDHHAIINSTANNSSQAELKTSNNQTNLSNDKQTKEQSTLSFANGDHPYCNLAKKTKRRNKPERKIPTRTRSRQPRINNKQSNKKDSQLKNILISNQQATSSKPLAIVPIKVDLSTLNCDHNQSSKILIIDDSSLDSKLSIDKKPTLKLIDQEKLLFELNFSELPGSRMSTMIGGDSSSFHQNFLSDKFQPIPSHQIFHQQKTNSRMGSFNNNIVNNNQHLSTMDGNPIANGTSMVDGHSVTSLPPVQSIFNDQFISPGQQIMTSSNSFTNNLFDPETDISEQCTAFNDFKFEDDLLSGYLPYGLFYDDDNELNQMISSSSIGSSLPSSSATPSPVIDGTGDCMMNVSCQNVSNNHQTSNNNMAIHVDSNLERQTHSFELENSDFPNVGCYLHYDQYNNNNQTLFNPIIDDTPKNHTMFQIKSLVTSPMMNGNHKNQDLTLTQLAMIPNNNSKDNDMISWTSLDPTINPFIDLDSNKSFNYKNKQMNDVPNLIIPSTNGNGRNDALNSNTLDELNDCIDETNLENEFKTSQNHQPMFNNVATFSINEHENVVPTTSAIPQIRSSPSNISQGQTNSYLNIQNDFQQRQQSNSALSQLLTSNNSNYNKDTYSTTNLVSKSSLNMSANQMEFSNKTSNMNKSFTGNCPELTALISSPSFTATTSNGSKIPTTNLSPNSMTNGYTMNSRSQSFAILNQNNRIRNNSMSTDISSHDEGFASQPEDDFEDSDNNSELVSPNNNNGLIYEISNIKNDQQLSDVQLVSNECGSNGDIGTTNLIQLQPVNPSSSLAFQTVTNDTKNDNVWSYNDSTSTSRQKMNTEHSSLSIYDDKSTCQNKSNLSPIDDNEESDDDDDDSFYDNYNASDLINATISDDVNNKWSLNMGRSRKGNDKRYFWQYNVQSKGPKGPRMGCGSFDDDDDPHVFNEIADPVFAPDCQVEGVKHSGKARRGDGNDLTANPRKLVMIGLELKKLSKIINELTPVTELPITSRNKSRKEKNKLASRACRLKKKAQHEANKIKLHGLHSEHSRLIKMIDQIRSIINVGINFKESSIHANHQSHSIEFNGQTCLITSINDLETFTNKIIDNNKSNIEIAGKTADFVNKILDNVTFGIHDGGLNDY